MFEAGQDVVVSYQGEECLGEVIESHHGWVLARVVIDPVTDWGDDLSPILSPVSQVMVRERDVRLVE